MELRYCLRNYATLLILTFSCLINSHAGAGSKSAAAAGAFILSTASTPAIVTAKPVDSLTQTSVRLNGTINPQGIPGTVYHFLYGVTASYSDTTANQTLTNSTGEIPVHAKVAGLTANTFYHFALVASNSQGKDTSTDATFQTLPVNPQLLDLYSVNVDRFNATFIGKVEANSANGKAIFRYGTDSSLSQHSDTVSLAPGGVSLPTASVLGLQQNKIYYYAMNVITPAGSFSSPIKSFATLSSTLEYFPDEHTAALYHFNGAGSQQVLDYSGHHHDGSTNATTATGIYGSGLNFEASGSLLYIPDNDSSLSFPTANFTLEAWVRPNGYNPGFIPLMNKGTFANGDGSWSVRLDQDGNIYVDLSTDGTNVQCEVFTTTSPVKKQTWNHVGIVVDSTNLDIAIYVNGVNQGGSQVGSFPTDSIFKSPAQVHIGSIQPAAGGVTIAGSEIISIDEVRISNIARDHKEFTQIRNSLQGTVFNDMDGDGIFGGGDVPLEGWGVNLFAAGDASGIPLLSTVTDFAGTYRFDGIVDGDFVVAAADSQNWIRTAPISGKYTVSLSGPVTYDELNFGNLQGCRYLGGVVTDPASWSCGHVPTSNEGLIIPNTGSLTELPTDSVAGIRVGTNANFTYGAGSGLKVRGSVVIDQGGTIQFDTSVAGAGLTIYGNLDNSGSFDGGHSTITFAGDRNKVISFNGTGAAEKIAPVTSSKFAPPRSVNGAVLGNSFYNLVINGASASTQGNITVTNQFSLSTELDARPQDTVFITSGAPESFTGDGRVPHGTVSRAVQNGASGAFRFESDLSTVDFAGSPSYPGTITQTPGPDSTPHAWQLYWEQVGGTVNIGSHTVTVPGVNHFSKWIVGRPGGGIRPINSPRVMATQSLQMGFDTSSAVRRVYQIGVGTNNGQFNATLSLRYDETELAGVLDESSLQLFRGPIVIDSLRQGWNLVSLPVTPDNAAVSALFPTAISSAYAYTTGYTTSSSLAAGTGYWLKLPVAQTDSIMGNDYDNLSIPVTEGWNLIGALSYPAQTSNVSSPDGVTFGPFYGYNHGYSAQTSLEPLQGYWVKASQTGHIIVSAPAGGSNAPKTRPAPSRVSDPSSAMVAMLNSLGSLVITDAAGNSQTLYYGTETPALSPMSLELPPAPPAGVMNARFSNNLVAALAPVGGQSDRSLELSGVQYPVTIRWSGKSAGTLNIANVSKGNLDRAGLITLSSAASISVHIEGASSVDDGKPKSFALYQNYPNPFNPQTTIKFDLAAPARVALDVYNVLGQQVASLIEQADYSAGAYQVPFDGSRFSSGVYFYRIMTSTGFTAVHSMVILK